MFNIAKFLQRTKNSRLKAVAARDFIVDSLQNVANIMTKPSDISVKDGIVKLIGLSAAAKATIFIKKDKLIQDMNNKQNFLKIIDIRY